MARPRRPSIEIDPRELARLARTGAPQWEIAGKLGVSVPTLERRLRMAEFQNAYMMGKCERNISIRAKQTEMALAGNVVMLKHIGINDCGQFSSAHRFVDKAGEDKDLLPIDALREWIRGAPEDE